MNVSYRHPGPFAAIGLFVAFAAAVVLAVAANADTSWVYGENMFSDLGVSDVQLSADLFNYGCIILGILLFVFGLGKSACELGCNRASGCMVAIAAIFLILIGYITSDVGNGNTHELVVALFYLFLFVAVVLSAFGDWSEGYRINTAVSAIVAVIVIGSAVGMGIEEVSVIGCACAVVWLAAVSTKMIFETRKS